MDRTLDALAGQRLAPDRFEVIVADDGSSDGTADVVRRHAGRLRMRYHFQPDLGFRAAGARNGGARLAAADLLAFLDTGMLVGPDWLTAHLAAHRDRSRPGRAVLGYSYGYGWQSSADTTAEVPDFGAGGRPPAEPESVPESVRDMRHPDFSRVDFDLDRMLAPWVFLWTLNLSVPAEDFWAVGGFDESFIGWGVEDIDLGYRLYRSGVRIGVDRSAWAIATPHDRDQAANFVSLDRNARYFAAKHRAPRPELYSAVVSRAIAAGRLDRPYEDELRALLDAAAEARDRDVRAELHAATADVAGVAASRIAVFGCGGAVPSWWASAPAGFVLCDYDRDLLAEAAGDPGRFPAVNVLGLRTSLPDDSCDLVVITSRLAGVWSRWGDQLLAEAARIGRATRVPFRDAPMAVGGRGPAG